MAQVEEPYRIADPVGPVPASLYLHQIDGTKRVDLFDSCTISRRIEDRRTLVVWKLNRVSSVSCTGVAGHKPSMTKHNRRLSVSSWDDCRSSRQIEPIIRAMTEMSSSVMC